MITTTITTVKNDNYGHMNDASRLRDDAHNNVADYTTYGVLPDLRDMNTLIKTILNSPNNALILQDHETWLQEVMSNMSANGYVHYQYAGTLALWLLYPVCNKWCIVNLNVLQ